MPTNLTTEALFHLMLGDQAVSAPLNIFIQSGFHPSGIAVCSVVGVIPQNVLRDRNVAEMWQCHAVIRPVQKFYDTQGNFRGAGLGGAFTTMGNLDLWGERWPNE